MEDVELPAELYQHGEKTLAAPVRPGLFACCPTMDLIAVVCQDAQLDVYRLNGQRAFGYSPPNPSSVITALGWKYNGTALALGWEDGSIDVISAETGKALQHIPNTHADVPGANREAVRPVAVLGWGLSFTKPKAVLAKLDSQRTQPYRGEDTVSLDDFLARLPEPKLLDLDQTLPDQLATLDFEGQLPRLPALPPMPAGTGSKPDGLSVLEAFASQASLDAVLHPQRATDADATDVLLRFEADAVTLPVLYGSLALRPLRRPAGLSDVLPIRFAYSPFASSHMVLAKAELPSTSGGGRHLALLPLTLPFTTAANRHTQTISSKSAKVQTLLGYIAACLDSITYHWRQIQDLPGRLMRVISDTLEENDEMGLVAALYHLAATGHCTATVKEWLTEQLMERGHKRWDHTVKLGYAKIVELAHDNLLPAIDRCTLLLSNLRGLAAYYQDTGVFDVPPRRMTVTLEALQCLRILSHHLLHLASVEKSQFSAFSKWLRHEIGCLSADPAASEDTIEQDPGIDYRQVVAYIRGPLSESKLRPFVSDVTDGLPEIAAEDMTPQLIAKHFKALRNGGDYRAYALSMKAHFATLKVHSTQLFDLVVEWQLANSAYHMVVLLDEADVVCSDICMGREEAGPQKNHAVTYAALTPARSDTEVHLYRVLHADMVVGQKCIEHAAGLIVDFGGQRVRDVRFADDKCLVAVVDSPDGTSLVYINYRDTGVPYARLQASVVRSVDRHAELVHLERPSASISASVDSAQQDPGVRLRRHVFPLGSAFSPETLAVNGRKDRRLIYVLSQDRRHYKVLDFDNQAVPSAPVPRRAASGG